MDNVDGFTLKRPIVALPEHDLSFDYIGHLKHPMEVLPLRPRLGWGAKPFGRHEPKSRRLVWRHFSIRHFQRLIRATA